MSWPGLQAIDCDIHPSVPSMRALLPYLDDHWRETVEARGIASLESISYPRHAPLTARPDWRDESGQAATDLAAVRTQLLDHFGVRLAICNCLYGVQLVFDAYMARAFARAVNDWIAKKWLDPEPRLRASIVVPLQDPEFAVEEIERCAGDRRFLQVLVLAMGELPLGRRAYWAVYAAAERHGLTIGIHAGSSYRHPVTSVGWPTRARRVVAKVEWHRGELYHRVGFIVTSLSRPNGQVVKFYNGRGTTERSRRLVNAA